MKNVLEHLENSSKRFPNKIAFSDGNNSITYSELVKKSKSVGSALCELGFRNKPVLICIEKSIELITTMFGIVYSGNFYVVLDVEMPVDRAKNIYETLNPVAIITMSDNNKFNTVLTKDCERFDYEKNIDCEINNNKLNLIRERMIDTDPLYALFTSGSTGVPKGAVINHRNVISYAQWVTETFDINSDTIFGNQTPFYFSMSVTDIYSTIQNAATLYMIPKKLFTFPLKLLQFLNEHSINTIYWVPSALSLVANWKALDYITVSTLKKILFAGEVMPTRQLNIWIEHIPDAIYANLYGPTEVTDICTYYIVNRKFNDDESLPIGNPCNNCDVIILDENNREAEFGKKGELCVRGSFLAPGYFNNSEKTAQVFVQNPLNPYYPEMIYKTGDIVKYNEYGELIYLSRKDFQIKHMGYRIELGEIEVAVSVIDEIKISCCVYDDEKDKIVLVYEGKSIEKKLIMDRLKERLPQYMWPNKIINVKQMPHNANGKIDRAWLKDNYKKL